MFYLLFKVHNFATSRILLHVLKFVLSFICSAKNKMVVIGKKKYIKARKRLPQKKRRQWNVREKLMVVNFLENNNGNVRGTAKNSISNQKKCVTGLKKRKRC
jgi:hypothetical protein